MPVPYGDSNFHTLNHVQFAADVEEATDGKLQLKIHPSGSLFKHPEIKNAVRSGQVPIGEFLLSRLSNEDALFQADSVPFLASSYIEIIVPSAELTKDLKVIGAAMTADWIEKAGAQGEAIADAMN